MFKSLTPIVLVTIFAYSTIAQVPTPKPDKEQKQELREAAVAFLRETSLEVDRMRSIENRISFSSELASLMWFHDENEARQMYSGLISDLNQLLAQLDSRSGYIQADAEDFSPGLFGGSGRSPVDRKFQVALGVRQQIAMNLSDHDPELALNFFYDSANRISNAELRKQLESSDKFFEMQLITHIAENDAAKAAEFGSRSLKNGVSFRHLELLKKIYVKNTDKGIEFGSAILSQLRSGRQNPESERVIPNLFDYGVTTIKQAAKTEGRKPVYSRGELSEIAEMIGQLVLNGEYEVERANDIADKISEYAPGRAAQIRAKYRKSGGRDVGTSANAVPRMITANTMTYGSANAVGIPNDARVAELKAAADAESKMITDIMGVNASMPKDERDRVIAASRDIISHTPGRDKKVMALTLLAAQVASSGDKDLAKEVMRDAERFVDPQPRTYRDFMLTWMLASGYANVDAEKAFPILENAIYRTNSLIEAFVRIGEFVDVNQDLISDGEVQVGAFGGSMLTGLISGLGIANSTVRALAEADFAKTRALANSFDRIETRVLAKMLIVRAVLDEKKPDLAVDEMQDVEGYEDEPARSK